MSQLTATTSDGVVLALRRVRGKGLRRGVLVCTHAMMANGSYFARGFADFLAERGLDIYILDWRGHGKSVPPDPRTGTWTFDDYARKDLPAALAAVAADASVGVDELVYLGHSLGGLAGLAGFATHAAPTPRKIALFATSVWLPGSAGPRARRWLMRAYRWAARPLGYAPIRSLRIGSDDESRGYVDQLTGWAASGRWTSRDGVDYLAALGGVQATVWGVNGAGDRLSNAADAQVLLDRLPGALPLRTVGVAHGDAIDADHFTLFSDARLSPLWSELAEFAIAPPS